MNKKIITLVIGAGLLVSANNVALAASTTKVTVKKPVVAVKTKTVVNPVNTAWDLINNAKSYNYVMTMPMTVKTPIEVDKKATTEVTKLNISIKGAVQDQYTKTQKQDLNINYQIKSDSLKKELGMEAVNLGADMKTIGDDYYARLSNYPAIVDALVNLSALKGKWVKFSATDLGNLLTLSNQMSGATSTSANTDLLMSNLKLETQIANRTKVTNLIKSSKAFTVTKALPNGKMDKSAVKRWQFTVNKLELAKLMIELNKLSGTPMTAEDINLMNNGLRAWNMTSGELSIGTKNEVVSFKLNCTNNNPDNDVKTKDSMTINFDWTIKNLNSKSIKIAAPASSISLSEAAGLIKVNTSTLAE